MQTPRQSIEDYIRAKDENRPYLMSRAFAEAATLAMVVKTGTISFPPDAQGREAVTDVLVRRFGLTYENVRTHCLGPPPRDDDTEFSCDWIVGMSEKASRNVRVGCGRYDWSFRAGLVERLTITIEVMQVLAPDSVLAIMDWLAPLPHPWCPAQTMLAGMPPRDDLQPIRQYAATR